MKGLSTSLFALAGLATAVLAVPGGGYGSPCQYPTTTTKTIWKGKTTTKTVWKGTVTKTQTATCPAASTTSTCPAKMTTTITSTKSGTTVTTTKPATTITTTKSGTTVTTTKTQQATPSCVSYEAKYDDVTADIIQLTQLGLYEGLFYDSMRVVDLSSNPIIGLTPQSGDNVVGFEITAQLTQGNPMLYPVAADYVNLQSFYYGCTLLATTSILNVDVLPCTIQVIGFRGGSVVATQDFTYNPGLLAGLTGKQPMQLATLSGDFTNLDAISFKNTGSLEIAELAAFDNVNYQLCSYKP